MKRLIFRLSSLGDVILSQSILEPPYSGETHWVVSKEFSGLVVGHPKVNKVWVYDRTKSPGLSGWLKLLVELRAEKYSEVLDAHSTLRTFIARVYFAFRSPDTEWRKISKERWRRILYATLKRWTPVSLRPTHLSRRCAVLARGSGSERANLRWLVGQDLIGRSVPPSTDEQKIAIVPSSAWVGKEWPTSRYLDWIRQFRADRPETEILILGTAKDLSAIRLAKKLSEQGVVFENGIAKYSLSEVAALVARCRFVLGSDTGILHLAEAIGTPVVTLFGPTRADYGFGPLDLRSTPAETSLWCSPCSKDGSLCFRIFDRYACLNRMGAEMADRSVAITEQKITENSRVQKIVKSVDRK